MHAQTWRTRSVPRRADPCCTCAMQSASELQTNYTTHRDTVAHLSHEKRAGWPPVSTLRPTYCSHLLPLARCLPFSHNVAFPFAFLSHSLFFCLFLFLCSFLFLLTPVTFLSARGPKFLSPARHLAPSILLSAAATSVCD